jgi:hypothetical protein
VFEVKNPHTVVTPSRKIVWHGRFDRKRELEKGFHHETLEICEMEKGIDARPHPSLLPQEKEEYCGLWVYCMVWGMRPRGAGSRAVRVNQRLAALGRGLRRLLIMMAHIGNVWHYFSVIQSKSNYVDLQILTLCTFDC